MAESDVQKESVLKACRHILNPIVRFLLRHRVTWKEFADLSKDVFVDVARSDYGLQGRPTNNSRVSMLTGLSRREVTRVRDRIQDDGQVPVDRPGSRLSQILTGWHLDDEFTDSAGKPKDLPPTGLKGSLQSLLKRYAGDLPHSALKKEMLHEGLMEELSGGELRVLKRDYTYQAVDPEIISQMAIALHDHAATLVHNLNTERQSRPRFEGIAENVKISSRAAAGFMKLVEERGMEFLGEIDEWLSQHQFDERKHKSGREIRLGVGVYLICDEMKERQSK